MRSITKIAAAEKIDRVLRLALLAPEVVEAIVEGRQPGMTLPVLMNGLPVKWDRQRDLPGQLS